MRITSLTVRNFRSLEEFQFTPREGLNFIVGPNASGKTTVLEGIEVLSKVRSFRTTDLEELIQEKKDHAEIHAQIEWRDGTESPWVTDLNASLQRIYSPEWSTPRLKKRISINGKGYMSGSQYILERFRRPGVGFQTVTFHPEDHEMIRGGPSLRRKWIDNCLGASREDLFGLFRDYKQVLDQRNAALSNHSSKEMVSVFTEKLVPLGARVIRERFEALRLICELAEPLYQWISDSKMKFDFLYESSKKVILDPDLKDLEEMLQLAFKGVQEKERILETTMVGPHRDDWGVNLDRRSVQLFGSQGEIRSTLIALKLAEAHWIEMKTGLKPIFLLDDFSSELDNARRKQLLEFLKETKRQSFITTTENLDFPGQTICFKKERSRSSFREINPLV